MKSQFNSSAKPIAPSVRMMSVASFNFIRTLFYHRLPSMTDDTQSELERLRAENAALKKASAKGLSLKVSEKGALSVYGLGRFPVTLYKEQWAKLLDSMEDIREFLRANDSAL